jgi:hypothetical protein
LRVIARSCFADLFVRPAGPGLVLAAGMGTDLQLLIKQPFSPRLISGNCGEGLRRMERETKPDSVVVFF